MKNTYVIGDIHGSNIALEQVLIRSPVQEGDCIIFLGDYVDGWSQSYEVIDTIIKLKEKYNVITIKGNHDQWMIDYIKTGIHGSNWKHGAEYTRISYIKNCDLLIPDSHINFYENLIDYYVDEENRCFVHGGFNRHELINEQHFSHIYYWDRDLWYGAMSCRDIDENRYKIKNNFKEVFIGHTSTINWDYDTRFLPENMDKAYLDTPIITPMYSARIWNLDTGGGYRGKLTMMNINTKEYYQSDLVDKLHINERGRN